MSINNLLSPNNFNLFVNSVFSTESFSAAPNANQTLNPAADVQLVFDNGLVTVSSYSTVTSTYTVPATGVYHFYCNVQLNYGVTLSDSVLVSCSLLNGATKLQIASSLMDAPAAPDEIVVQLPLMWYGLCNAGDLITVQADQPISSAHGAGNFAVYGINKVGTIFFGVRG